ncbi:tRNA (adenosine(37)-N6)-threonylcarbamoyltransferase complex dimerization subunit type 1 TsaB [Chitinilyticum litopenaei]|uniref:tRNA (adenosine(37)-N6)-threonylcarbamoyltransferase complex dimerization subunit type 1 TsaB n=1 Tax=Chitinilyticum litopenaei TaxID=1121276 RepID=UPI0004101762|nr:tRNA (adenosine(37)-N6)-threonylcarbamoyltransferase complex dimerization subunit type 1 TsaB [Chitinilyticum litopenaei]
MAFLALDTATDHLSLALATPTGLVARDWHVGQKHAELTLPRLRELLEESGTPLAALEGLAFAAGPGSFTGLRIGCGIAQGLAFALGIPLLGISTLEALAEAAQATHPDQPQRVYCCLDARMNQVYAAAYARTPAGWQLETGPVVCDPQAIPLPAGTDWLGAGSGFALYGDVLQARLGEQLAGIDATLAPRASHMLALAQPRFAAGQGVPPHEAELLYLRDKVALKTHERG